MASGENQEHRKLCDCGENMYCGTRTLYMFKDFLVNDIFGKANRPLERGPRGHRNSLTARL